MKKLQLICGILLISAIVLSACAPAAAPTTALEWIGAQGGDGLAWFENR